MVITYGNIKKLVLRIFLRLNEKRGLIRAFIPSLIFNFRHLPFSQAVKVPFVIYRGQCGCTGKYEIRCKVRFGMIELGKHRESIIPSIGIVLKNEGLIVFNGRAIIGSGAVITLGKGGKLEIGDNFNSTTGLRLSCYNSIRFEHDVFVGSDCLFTDNDIGGLKNVNGGGV